MYNFGNILRCSESREKFEQNQLVETVVTGLNPYTQYIFRVFGVNVYGMGVPSKVSRKLLVYGIILIDLYRFLLMSNYM